MKKILPVIILMIFVWGCAKKMTPAKTETPTTNSGSVINNTQPVSSEINSGKGTGTTTSSTATSTTVTQTTNPANAGAAGSRATTATATSPEAAAVIAGQATFNAKCGRCHGLKVAGDYTADRWASILAVMAPRANLTDTEKTNVYAYVKENSKK